MSIKIISYRNYELLVCRGEENIKILVSDIILCTGYASPVIPDLLKPYSGCDRFICSPYPENEMLSRLPKDSRVLIVGSKLSAIDAAIILCRERHRVTMISSSGELPVVRARIKIKEYHIDSESLRSIFCMLQNNREMDEQILIRQYLRYFLRIIANMSSVPLRRQFSRPLVIVERLREDIAIAERGNCCWQDGNFRWIEAANAMFLQNPDYFRYGLTKGFRHYLGRYLTPVALPNAKKILSHIEGKTLSVEKGVITTVFKDMETDAWKVSINGACRYFDAIVCAAGFHHPEPVFGDTGSIMLNSDGQGGLPVKIDSDYSVLLADGAQKESIWFTGAVLRKRIFATDAVFLITAQSKIIIDNLSKMK